MKGLPWWNRLSSLFPHSLERLCHQKGFFHLFLHGHLPGVRNGAHPRLQSSVPFGTRRALTSAKAACRAATAVGPDRGREDLARIFHAGCGGCSCGADWRRHGFVVVTAADRRGPPPYPHRRNRVVVVSWTRDGDAPPFSQMAEDRLVEFPQREAAGQVNDDPAD